MHYIGEKRRTKLLFVGLFPTREYNDDFLTAWRFGRKWTRYWETQPPDDKDDILVLVLLLLGLVVRSVGAAAAAALVVGGHLLVRHLEQLKQGND